MAKPTTRFPQKPELEIKKDRIYWDEDEWGVLANRVVELRRSSPEPMSTLAAKAQEILPPNRRRKNLTSTCLKPLYKRVFRREKELYELAMRAEEAEAKLSFCEDLPKQKADLIATLDDEAVMEHFMPRVLQLVAPADLLGAFDAEILLSTVPTPDLAAAFAKRFVTELTRPTVIHAAPETKAAQQLAGALNKQTETAQKKSNGRKRRVLIVGIRRGSQQQKINEAVGDMVQLRFLEASALKSCDFPTAVDHVIIWAQMLGHKQKAMVKGAYPPRSIIMHTGGLEAMTEIITDLACALR